MFKNLGHLKSLKIGYNPLESLPSDTFLELGDLELLSLPAVGLTSIESELFKSLSNLKYLNLLGNRIDTIQSEAFSDTSNLTTLYLSQLNFTDGGQLPSSLASLKELYIDPFEDQMIDDNFFENLKSLENVQINISRQDQVLKISDTAFRNLKELKELSMSGGVKAIPSSIYQLDNLERVNLATTDIGRGSLLAFWARTGISPFQVGQNLTRHISNPK